MIRCPTRDRTVLVTTSSSIRSQSAVTCGTKLRTRTHSGKCSHRSKCYVMAFPRPPELVPAQDSAVSVGNVGESQRKREAKRRDEREADLAPGNPRIRSSPCPLSVLSDQKALCRPASGCCEDDLRSCPNQTRTASRDAQDPRSDPRLCWQRSPHGR